MTFDKALPGAILLLCTTACSNTGADGNAHAAEAVDLRNLTEEVSAPAQPGYVLQGDLIPTPSDTRAKYYLLRSREPLLSGSRIALLRQEVGPRIAYARVEVDCARRLFHVLSVGNRRSFAETSIAYDGPLRPIDGLPLRQELASYVCKTAGTALAPA